jgi:hypothetical protein
MKFNDFIKKCQEKEVFKNLSIYLVSSWLLLQVFSVIWEPLGLPKVTLTYLLLILLLGFPFYMYLIWRFRLKSIEELGVKKSEDKTKSKVASSKSAIELEGKRTINLVPVHLKSSFHKMYFTFLLVIGFITVFSASLIIKNKFMNGSEDQALSILPEPEKGNKIAVLKFVNNTLDEKLDVVGKMAVDWIMHGITQNKVGQVISPKIIEEYSNVMKASMIPDGDQGILKEFLKPSKIITGSYYLSEGQLLLQCSILDENMNKTLISFEPVDCDPSAPLDCIEALKQRILGYLVMEKDPGYSFEETPPNFVAYQYLLEAHTKYSNADSKYLDLLNEAIEADSTFFEPKIDRLEYYYNKEQFEKTDSLFLLLAKESNNNKRQMNLLNCYEALLKGDNRSIYKYFRNEYEIEPFDLENNNTAMVLALQYVNRPEDVDAIYSALSMDQMDMEKCRLCEFRNYMKALATIELGHPEEAVQLLEPYAKKIGYEFVKEALLLGYIVLQKEDKVKELLDDIKLTNESERWYALTVFCGKEYLLQGNKESAQFYFDQVIWSIQDNFSVLTQTEKDLLAYAYYYKEDYAKAEKLLEEQFNRTSDPTILSYLAIAAHNNGKKDVAALYIERLDQMRSKFEFGKVDYALAQYYGALGDEKRTLDHLLKAVADGKRYNPSTYQHDIHFKPYLQTAAFDRVMNFWK